MSIGITCPNCSKQGKVPDSFAGQTVRCPQCKEMIRVAPPAPSVVAQSPSVQPDTVLPAEVQPDNVLPAEQPIPRFLMSRRHVLIAAVGAVALVVIGTVGFFLLRKTAVSGEPVSGEAGPGTDPRWPTATVSARDLALAYQAQVAADKQYTGKPIIVAGNVAASQQTKAGARVQLGELTRFSLDPLVDCYFISEQEAASLKTTQYALVLGTCKGVGEGGRVQLIQCEKVDDISKYRIVPKPLRDQFAALTPAATFARNYTVGLPEWHDNDNKVIEIATNMGGIDPKGPGNQMRFSAGGGINLPVICFFPDGTEDALKKVASGWPIRVRGRVRYHGVKAMGDQYKIELFDCGMIYDASAH